MTRKWSRQIVFAGLFVLLMFALPIISRGADQRSADEPALTQAKSSGESDPELQKRLQQIDSDIEAIIGEQDRIKEKLKKDRMEWSGSLRVTCNNFHLIDKSLLFAPIGVLDANGNLVGFKAANDTNKSYGSAWTMRLRLTMEYEITETLRFYGQMIGYKYLNLNKTNPYLLDMEITRYPLDAGLRLERAFFEWRPVKWFGISAGRVASPEGPPAELKENTIRNATWGVQMVEADMEGIGFGFMWNETDIFRFAYLPYANFADARINNDNNLFSNDGYKEFHAFAALLEMKIPYIGDNVFQLGSVLVPNFGFRDNAIFVYGPNEPYYPENPKPGWNDLGLYGNVNTVLELKNIAGSGLDLFAAYTLTFLKPTEQYMTYFIKLKQLRRVTDNTTGEVIDVDRGDYSEYRPVHIGLASANDDPMNKPLEWNTDLTLAHFVYVGFRYSPTEKIWSFFKNYPLRIGFEYNMGTRYHFTWSSPSDLLINKYGVRGNVYEAYIIQELVTGHLFVRLGYMFVERKYDGVYLGPAREVNQQIQNAYALIDAAW
jgi:hypothetical protein